MSISFSRLLTASGSLVKWILIVVFFPISIPIILVRLFLKKTPTLSKGVHVLGGAGIVIVWFWLFSLLPSKPPTAPETTPLAQNNAPQLATTAEDMAAPAMAAVALNTPDVKSETKTLATSSTQVTASAEPKTETVNVVATSSTEVVTKNQTLYPVVRVIDGDTVDLSIGGKTERVRLIGIDTPETVDPRKSVQCFGQEASAKLKSLLTGESISLEADASQDTRDKYGRLLGYLFLSDGTNVNLLMIQQGYANEYTYRTPYKYQAEFKAAAATARESKVGLWSDATCAGDTTKPATSTGTTPTNTSTTTTPAPTSTPSGEVKKSTTGICHEPGSTYYARTKNYTPYSTLEECLRSGGRLPQR